MKSFTKIHTNRSVLSFSNANLYDSILNWKILNNPSKLFMPPKELRWHIKIEPSVCLSVRPSVTNRVSAISHKLLKKFDETSQKDKA